MITRQDLKDNLNKDLNEGMIKFSSAVNFVTNRNIVLHLTRQDQFRILNFITWAERYHISLKNLLDILLKIWIKKFKSNSKGLGVRLSLLTGPRSKEIIKQYIKKTYPNNEHIKLKKQLDGDKLLTKHNLLDYIDPIEYIKRYKYNIIALRKEDNKMSKTMRRRSWRDNPFI